MHVQPAAHTQPGPSCLADVPRPVPSSNGSALPSSTAQAPACNHCPQQPNSSEQLALPGMKSGHGVDAVHLRLMLTQVKANNCMY